MAESAENIGLKPVKLLRKDGNIIIAKFYDNFGNNNIEILDIKN